MGTSRRGKIDGTKSVSKKESRSYTSGVRDSGKSKTRRTLIEVARKLAKEEGAEAITLQLIARHAKLGLRTIFRHFPTRADLMKAVDEPVVLETTVLVRSIDDLPALGADWVRQIAEADVNSGRVQCAEDKLASIRRAIESMYDPDRLRIAMIVQTFLTGEFIRNLYERSGGSIDATAQTINWALERVIGRRLNPPELSQDLDEEEPYID